MKKYLVSLAVLVGVFTAVLSANAYVVQKGDTPVKLWGSNWRTELAKFGISDPTKLPVGLNTNETLLGSTIPNTSALIDTYLASGISKTDTSMTLASGATRSGATLSGYICFTLDANTPQVEYTCGTASGASVTGLLRGVDVTNPNTTSTDLAFPHRRLASVQITDYPILQILARMVGGQDSTGSGTFIVGDDTNSIKLQNTTTSNKYIYAWGNTGNPFLRYNGSNWQFSDDGTNIVSMVTGGSGLAASTTQGIQIINSLIGINASSTTGGAFDSSGKYYQKIDTATGVQYSSGSAGIGINTSTLVSLIATSTPSASKIVASQSNGDVDLGWIPDGASSLQYYTAGETLDSTSGPIAVYSNSVDGRVYKTSSGISTTTFSFVGFVVSGQNQSAGTSVAVQQSGLVYNFSSLTTSSAYYISTTGSVSTTPGTVGYKIGKAINETTLFIEKGKKTYIGTTSFSASASTTITIGFRATSVKINSALIAGYSTANGVSMGGWAQNGNFCIAGDRDGFGNVTYSERTNAWWAMYNSGTPAYHYGDVVNITNTGFTLSNTKINSPANMVLFYQAEE